MSTGTRILTGACLLLTLLAAERSMADDDARTWSVEEVSIKGNEAFDNDRLKRIMVTRPAGFLRSSTFYPRVFNDDLANLVSFYRQNGYLSAQVTDTLVQRDSSNFEVRIELTVDEGPLTHVEGISVFGNEVFPDSALLELVELEPGDPFNRRRLQAGMVKIAERYADHGYLEAAVTPDVKINEIAHLAVIDLNVTERQQSSISGIRIKGLQRTRSYVVERELSFEEGEVVNYSELSRSQYRLYLTGLFRSVYISPVKDSAGSPVNRIIVVDVEEKLNSEFSVSVGYGSIEKIKGRTELSTNNLAGTARQIGIMVEADFIKRGVEGSFTEPRTFGTRFRTDLNLFFRYHDEPSYDVSRYGGRLTVGRKFGDYGNVSAGYRYEDATLRHIETDEIPEDVDSRVRSITVGYQYDTRNNLFNPTRGWYFDVSYELAGGFLRGTDAFSRIITRTKWFHPLNTRTVIGTALQVGWMDVFGETRQVPLNERFYTGGPSSIRGFGYQLVGPLDEDGEPTGGKFKIVWNLLEIRRAVYKMFGVVAFVDAGNVWWSAADFRLDEVRGAAGAGIRANTPIGILRLDYGFNLDPRTHEDGGKLYLSMGHAF